MVIGSSTARLPDPDGYAPKDSLRYRSTSTSQLTAFTTAPLGTIPILGEELDPTRYRLALIEPIIGLTSQIEVAVGVTVTFSPLVSAALSVEGRYLRTASIVVSTTVGVQTKARPGGPAAVVPVEITAAAVGVDMQIETRAAAVGATAPVVTSGLKRRAYDTVEGTSGSLDTSIWPSAYRFGGALQITNSAIAIADSKDGVHGAMFSNTLLGNDQFMEGKLVTIGDTQGRANALTVRSDDNAQNCVVMLTWSGTMYIFQSVGGSASQKAASSGGVAPAGTRVGSRAVGNVSTAYTVATNGVITDRVSWTDSSNVTPQTNKRLGIAIYRSAFVNGGTWDLLNGGDL